MSSTRRSRWPRKTRRSRSRSCRSIGNGCSSTPSQRVASVNQLVIPAGVPVHFSLTSASVMNAFFIPQLGSMIYTMNGMATQLNLHADEPGDVPRPVEPLQRRRLLRTCISTCRRCRRTSSPPGSMQPRSNRPDADRAKLHRARPAEHRTCVRSPTGDVDPELFQKIATQALPPGPGPSLSEPSPAARSHSGRRSSMLGKLTWAAIPFDQPIPLFAAGCGRAGHPRRPRLDHAEGLAPLSLARVDHQRRPQADRRDVRPARRG